MGTMKRPATPEAQERRDCQRRRQYPDLRTADKIAAETPRRNGPPFEAYKCAVCELYHVRQTRGDV